MANLSNNILSREEYLAAYNSNDFQNYLEHVLLELTRPLEHVLFEHQYKTFCDKIEESLQELVNATPKNTDVLERDFDDQHISLEEQRELVLKLHFERMFEEFKNKFLYFQHRLLNSARTKSNTSYHIARL